MKESSAIRVLVVDDHALLRGGITSLLECEPDMQVVAEATTGREAIEQVRKHRPDVTLMDLQMPGMSGLDAITAIGGEFPDARIVVLTTYSSDVQESGSVGHTGMRSMRPPRRNILGRQKFRRQS
jgi:DNA-binding NarL/FixJ family response regulator